MLMGYVPKLDVDNTFVISDTHFGHENIKQWAHRPQDVESIMLENWAQAVPDDGTVLHLGDLCWKGNAWFKNMIAPHLTGATKYLILGNHDKQRRSFYRDCGFRVIDPFTMLWIPESPFRAMHSIEFSHYPATELELEAGQIRIHGHIHNAGYGGKFSTTYMPFSRNQINISVEQTKYRPVNLGALLRGALIGAEYPGESKGAPE